MEVQKAYSVLSEKKLTEDEGFYYIEGLASTPTPDRTNDVMVVSGAQYELPQKLFMHHNTTLPIGNMIAASPNAKGIPCKWALPKIAEPGIVKDRLDEAIHSLKYNLLNAFSIGFRPLKYALLPTGGYEFQEWDWYETSLVGVPMNAEAILRALKSNNAPRILTATGHTGKSVQLIYPGATGQKPAVTRPGTVKLIPKEKS